MTLQTQLEPLVRMLHAALTQAPELEAEVARSDEELLDELFSARKADADRMLGGKKVTVRRKGSDRAYVVNRQGNAYLASPDRTARFGSWRRMRWVAITSCASTKEATEWLAMNGGEDANEPLPFARYAKAGIITFL